MQNVTTQHPQQASSPWERVTHGLTLTLSVLACGLNCAVLLVLTGHRARERRSGMLTLTTLEILVNAALAAYLLCQWTLKDHQPWQVGLAMHGLQMVRNNWLLCIALYRVALTIRPSLAARPHLQLPAKRQAAYLVAVLAVTTAEMLLANLWSLRDQFGGGGDGPRLLGNLSEDSVAAEAALKAPVYKYVCYAAVGVLLPGACILVVSAKIAHSLRSRYASHRSSKRTSKIILLLAVSFVPFQFPFAATYVATGAYLLSAPMRGISYAQVTLFEVLANWSGVFQPVDSCLNFFILLRYSQSFKLFLRQQRRLRRRRRRRRTATAADATDRRQQRLIVYRAHRARCVYTVRGALPRHLGVDGAGGGGGGGNMQLLELQRFMRPEDKYG